MLTKITRNETGCAGTMSYVNPDITQGQTVVVGAVGFESNFETDPGPDRRRAFKSQFDWVLTA